MFVQREGGGGGEKRKPLARKLVKKFSMHIIPPEKTSEERALHILSLARVKFRIQQVGGEIIGDDVSITSLVHDCICRWIKVMKSSLNGSSC